MSIDLPRPIAAYFAADRADAAAVAACFTGEAVVKDEGKTHRGKSEIIAWKAETSRKYSYTSTPVAMTEENGKIVVICHLVGNFPGGEVDLRHIFAIEDGRIAFLHITI
ncbi:nuclear transport factor 2 family protein [Sphingopyxis sp. DBS4]|uniref:nuclear transport factor 2 family protein n=1 Tax=Sphingopyxis sp. DBS4 TaxID=2968500 RepID=UPI00214B1CEC|nr:nuclear transport factor 2 family protein [Sphingopyxis sp. DBS4]